MAGTNKVGSTQYGYDGNQVTSIVQQDGSGTVLANYSYQYDVAGRLSAETDNGVTTNYAYDAAGELTQAGSTSYTYDANGNPTGTGYAIGPNNQLLSDGTWNYNYDAAGNLIQKVNIADGTTWQYGYDVANHMTSAVERDAGGNVLVEASYTYDVFGNRLSETVTQDGTTTTTHYARLSDGTLYADLNGDGSLITRYITDVNGPNHWLARVETTAGAAWTLSDHLGSVRVVVDATGAVIDKTDYGAFGGITSQTDATAHGELGFQGGMFDIATGQNYFLAREYDPAARRWNEIDPMGFAAGQSNLYEPMGNGPTNGTDPSGRDEVSDWHHQAAFWMMADQGEGDNLDEITISRERWEDAFGKQSTLHIYDKIVGADEDGMTVGQYLEAMGRAAEIDPEGWDYSRDIGRELMNQTARERDIAANQQIPQSPPAIPMTELGSMERQAEQVRRTSSKDNIFKEKSEQNEEAARQKRADDWNQFYSWPNPMDAASHEKVAAQWKSTYGDRDVPIKAVDNYLMGLQHEMNRMINFDSKEILLRNFQIVVSFYSKQDDPIVENFEWWMDRKIDDVRDLRKDIIELRNRATVRQSDLVRVSYHVQDVWSWKKETSDGIRQLAATWREEKIEADKTREPERDIYKQAQELQKYHEVFLIQAQAFPLAGAILLAGIQPPMGRPATSMGPIAAAKGARELLSGQQLVRIGGQVLAKESWLARALSQAGVGVESLGSARTAELATSASTAARILSEAEKSIVEAEQLANQGRIAESEVALKRAAELEKQAGRDGSRLFGSQEYVVREAALAKRELAVLEARYTRATNGLKPKVVPGLPEGKPAWIDVETGQVFINNAVDPGFRAGYLAEELNHYFQLEAKGLIGAGKVVPPAVEKALEAEVVQLVEKMGFIKYNPRDYVPYTNLPRPPGVVGN